MSRGDAESGGRRGANEPILHSSFHLSLLPVEQTGVYCIVNEGTDKSEKIKRENGEE